MTAIIDKFLKMVGELSPQSLPSVSLIFGEEPYLVHRGSAILIEKISKTLREGETIIRKIDGSEVDYRQLLLDLSSPSLFSSKEIFHIKNTALFKSRSPDAPFRQPLLKLFDRGLPQGYSIVFSTSEPVDRSLQIYKFISKYGFIYEFPSLSPFDKGDMEKDEAYFFVRSWLKRENKTITPDAFILLRQLLPNDLWTLLNEVEKLISFVGERNTVESSDVLKVVPPSYQNIIFDLMDAVGNREIDPALAILSNLLEQGTDAVNINFMLYRHLKNILLLLSLKDNQIKEILNQQLTYKQFKDKFYRKFLNLMEEKAHELKATLPTSHPFPLYKLILQSQKIKLQTLFFGIKECHKIDLSLKSSSKDSRALLQLLLINLISKSE